MKIRNLFLSNLLIYSFIIKMKLPSFMKRFWNKEKWEKNTQSREEVVNKTAEEIWNIIRSWNFQWENFNKTVNYIESIIVWILENDAKLMNLERIYYTEKLSLALSFPLLVPTEDLKKENPEIREMYNKNLVTRVSTDSLRRHVILKALDGLLKISSREEFWERYYKIWDIEINSFEDLEKSRAQLQKLYEDFENYDIPWYKEAVEYAAKNGIKTNFYS